MVAIILSIVIAFEKPKPSYRYEQPRVTALVLYVGHDPGLMPDKIYGETYDTDDRFLPILMRGDGHGYWLLINSESIYCDDDFRGYDLNCPDFDYIAIYKWVP